MPTMAEIWEQREHDIWALGFWLEQASVHGALMVLARMQ